MTRKEFIKICGLMGLSIPFQPLLSATGNAREGNRVSFKGNVLIIGAGAAGLSAAYRLAQAGIDFQVLEAAPNHGGRMKTTNEFVDFPIPLGAEWLHTKKGILDEIVNNPETKVDVQTTKYDKIRDYALYDGEELPMGLMGFGSDQKFIGSSWLDFFEDYIVPPIRDKILYDQIVASIDYSRSKPLVTTSSETYEADKVILTVPVKMLQQNSITFTPPLPIDKQEALNKVTVWDGFKAFIEFSDKFYPTVIEFGVSPKKAGQKLYYDASYGQNSNRHVLGLFTVGAATLPYRQFSDDQLIDFMLEELDEIFESKASSNYIKHISQNWNEEPFIGGAYVYDHENWKKVRTLGKSVNGKVFFAGTSYTDGNDWGSVHNAIRSAIKSVDDILT